jgi:hypothetical protein
MSSESREIPGVGGLLQTQAVGPQDLYLYELDESPHCNPFTRDTSIRTTRGAIEVKEQEFSPFFFDTINRVEIQRSGDLVGDVMLEITLPSFIDRGGTSNDYWRENIGYILVKHVRLLLNDTELNSSERLFYDLYEKLYETDSTRRAIRDMIGGDEPRQLQLNREHTIIIPLKLFMSKRRGSRQTFMPMISTPGSSLYLEIETESFKNCVTSYSGNDPPRTLECRLLTEYVFIEDDEKEKIVNQPQTMLIETVRDAEGYSFREVVSSDGLNQIISSDTVVVSLKEMNFPAKAIIFAAYRTSDLQARRYFEYADVIDSVSIRFDGNDRTEGQEPIDYYRLIQPYMHAPRCTNDNIFFYSFALQPVLLQPTGVFSFSNIREGDLYIKLREPANDIVVKVFVIGYSWVQFKNGIASTLFQ